MEQLTRHHGTQAVKAEIARLEKELAKLEEEKAERAKREIDLGDDVRAEFVPAGYGPYPSGVDLVSMWCDNDGATLTLEQFEKLAAFVKSQRGLWATVPKD